MQEIYPAGEGDVAVNFIILPEFFDYGLKMMETDAASEQQKFIIQVLSYVEEHYKSGELTELAEELRFDIYWLSKGDQEKKPERPIQIWFRQSG